MSAARKPTKAENKIRKVMKEFKGRTLKSGRGGKVVRTRKQAIAIALSEARATGKRRVRAAP